MHGLVQVEADAQAATHANSLHFLTHTSLPTVGKLTTDLPMLTSRCIAHHYCGCCHWWRLRLAIRAVLQLHWTSKMLHRW